MITISLHRSAGEVNKGHYLRIYGNTQTHTNAYTNTHAHTQTKINSKLVCMILVNKETNMIGYDRILTALHVTLMD